MAVAVDAVLDTVSFPAGVAIVVVGWSKCDLHDASAEESISGPVRKSDPESPGYREDDE